MIDEETLIKKMQEDEPLTRQERMYAVTSESAYLADIYYQYSLRAARKAVERRI